MEQPKIEGARDYTDSFLSDLEKEKIGAFWDDDITREAVRKVILAGIYYNGTLKKGEKANPLVNFILAFVNNREQHLTNAEAGEELKAAWAGMKALEFGFSNLAKYTKIDSKPDPDKGLGNKNPAR